MTEMDKLYEREDIYDVRTVEELAGHYKRILELLGEDTSREGLLKTPERVAKAMAFLTKGYGEDPKEILLSAKFREDYRHMVVVKDIELYSMCEHHMLPFYGKAHVACIQEALDPMGVAVVIEAAHTCMQMRGIQKQNSVTTTSAFTGAFLKNQNTRQEFLQIISSNLR